MIIVFLVGLAFMSGIVLRETVAEDFPEDVLALITGLTIVGYGILSLAGAMSLMQIFS